MKIYGKFDVIFHIIIIIILVIINHFFRQEIYNYIPETNMRLGYIVLRRAVITISGSHVQYFVLLN